MIFKTSQKLGFQILMRNLCSPLLLDVNLQSSYYLLFWKQNVLMVTVLLGTEELQASSKNARPSAI